MRTKSRCVVLQNIFFLIFLFVFYALPAYSQSTFYWDSAKTISARDSRFPRTVDYNGKSFVFWEEVDSASNQIWISQRTYNTIGQYTDNIRFAGPFSYSGEVPDIYSAAVSSSGTVIVAVSSSDQGIKIYSSKNNCESFQEHFISSNQSMIAPRVFYSENGKFRLFTSLIQDGEFQLFYADSKDGLSWSSFRKFNPGSNFRNPFLPVSIVSGSSDIVVFQAQYSSNVLNRYSYQLYLTTTRDGSSWSTPILLTGQNSLPDSDPHNFAAYQNQRPNIIRHKGKIYLVWERTETTASQLWIAEITTQGLVNRTAIKLTSQGNASRAMLFEYNDSLFVEWFDTRSGNEKIYLAEKIGEDWEERCLVDNRYSNMFSTPAVIKDSSGKDQLSIIYQQTGNSNSIVTALMPDFSVLPPKITSSTYKIGKASRDKNVTYQIVFPNDTSGITGYAYTWGKDNQELPDTSSVQSVRNRILNLTAEEDGIYNLIIQVADKAGNWSEPLTVAYNRDITPPSSPQNIVFDQDDYGFAINNTLDFTWTPSSDDDVAGYNYQLEYLGSLPSKYAVNKTHVITQSLEDVKLQLEELKEKYKDKLADTKKLKSTILSSASKSKSFFNKDNGIYKFTVCAVDQVGNVSEGVSTIVMLNKYRPQTFVSSAYQTSDNLGEAQLVINGGGFTYEGTVTKIYIDKDGKAPYDLVLNKKNGDFKVKSDSKITDVVIGNVLDEGNYKVGIVHSDRGLYFTKDILQISKNGTIKIQSDYQQKPKYSFIENNYKLTIAAGTILLALIFIIVLLLLILFIVTVVYKSKERKLTLKEIKSLLSGEAMPLIRKQNKHLGKRQKSLREKLIGFTIALVILVTLFLSLQNGFNMINTQQATMADALQNKIDVLLESLSSGVKNFLPTENDLELGALPSQKDALAEAKYVTIIGIKNSSVEEERGEGNYIDYIWATNDPDIEMKALDYGQNGIIAGQTRITDPDILAVISKFDNLNSKTAGQISNISQQITQYSAQITQLASKNDEESVQKRSELSSITSRLRSELNSTLSQIANENTGSSPQFTHEILNASSTDYLFYKPVLYRTSSSQNYMHGIIIIQVSIQSLVDELHSEIRTVIIASAIAAVIALILGSFGAWILASLIVKPIKKLESQLVDIGIIMTREARERMRLSNKKIEIKSRDEIGHLGEVVNSMTEQLGKAAEDEFLNNDGKKVQGRFVPLQEDGSGGKLPIVKYNEEKLELFAFYKGDSPVSGDYFDYKKLDEQWYVFIKCDVSGHGVPAALLVSVVATKFKDFYYNSNWTYAKNGINLKKFVSAVNDFIYDLGARGKFSTINISLYNRHTGELYVCNAGDNKIHILDGVTKQLQEITLSDVTPTAGGIPSEMIEMKGGFKVEKLVLKPGDVLYLYTDGIDEAERLVRDFDFSVKQTVKEEKRMNRETGKEETTTQVLDVKEQFGQKRIEDVIQAVVKRQHYILQKQDNPSPSDILEFDFSTCKGTLEDSIIALAAVERVFRMVKSPEVRPSDEISVENFIDDFLKEHFSLYSKYCIAASSTEQIDEDEDEISKLLKNEDENVKKYSYIQEDKQADDITLIAIRRL